MLEGRSRNPRFRRALAHGAVVQALRHPDRPDLVAMAKRRVAEAGTSRKSRGSGFEQALSHIWHAPDRVRDDAWAMLAAGHRVDIVVNSEAQTRPAASYRSYVIREFRGSPVPDVQIVVDGREYLPNGARVNGRYRVNYHWDNS